MKSRKSILICSVVILIALMAVGEKIYAQQVPLYSLQMYEKTLINPAYAGIGNQVAATLLYKNKLAGFDGAPVTQVLVMHAPIQSKFMGVGFKVVNDQIGATGETSFNAMYSYHLGFASGKLSLGLEGGLINYINDFGQALKTDQIDEALPAGRESLILPDAATGLYYVSDKMHFGAAVYHLIPSKLDKGELDRAPRAQLSKHIVLSNGYNIDLGKKLILQPSWLLKYVKGAPAQFDVNLNIQYMDMISVGATYRTGDALVFLMRYSLAGQFHVAYAYDYTLSELSTYSGGSHEFSLQYTLELMEPAMKKITDPRYYY